MTAQSAYGSRAAKTLAALRPHTHALTRELCATFYNKLLAHAGRDDVVRQLDAEEFWASVGGHPLHQLLDPDLKRRTLRQSAEDLGRVLAYLGVENATLVETYDALITTLQRHPVIHSLPPAKQGLLGDILIPRVMTSLSGIVTGQRQIANGQQRVMSAVTRLAETCTTLDDLAQDSLETLLALDGMVAGTFARPDKTGTLQYEIVVGATMERHISTFASYQSLPSIYDNTPVGRGPSGRAWRSGKPQSSLNISREPALAPWREVARELGYGSNAAVPILDDNHETHAILSLYHGTPGYFSTPERQRFLSRLSAILSTALVRLGPSAPTVHYTTRADYRARLAQGALVMLYQPIIDLKTGQIAKVEALARLRNSDGTFVSPAYFLPAFGARDLRTLFTLGLRQAMSDLRDWERQGLRTSVSVNLPTQALSDPEYLAIAQAALRDLPMEPHRLTFELLETSDVTSRETTVRRLISRWRHMGVHLAQDDLGSGYSSLLRIERLAVDEVKIDQAFVRTVARMPHKALQFIHHLTRLVHDIGLPVVVEGLESRGLYEAAAILGADAGQGYVISRPLAASALQSWYRDFHISVNPGSPTTALGAYATLLLRGALIHLAQSRPALLRQAITEPCTVAAYIENAAIPEHAPLKNAYGRLVAAIRTGSDPQNYQKTHNRVEQLLCAEIRREENTMARDGTSMHGSARASPPSAP
ncbi:EAL domain-containing protein [Acidiferrobacter sp.]|uniref:EAL domain-containing protein n=1 Tax=Acidiferrobacter sp. TaxID=1872107 RepID=UPI00261BE9F1|nr:EAL domain-containing protein [Acidiferrobacter sp.]